MPAAMHQLARLTAATAITLAGGLLALPAVAAVNTVSGGCTATITTTQTDGQPLGSATFPGNGPTDSSPLPIDLSGSITFTASTPVPFTSGEWSVTMGGINAAGGTFTNPGADTQFTDSTALSGIPEAATNLVSDASTIPVTVTVTAPEGSCVLTGQVTGVAPASSTPVFYAGTALVLTGTTLTGALLFTRILV